VYQAIGSDHRAIKLEASQKIHCLLQLFAEKTSLRELPSEFSIKQHKRRCHGCLLITPSLANTCKLGKFL
jgi:hypothetical protein